MMSGMSGEQDVELDPDLLQPSVKNQPQESPEDIEINDEDDVLKNMKHNQSDDQEESPMSNDSESGNSEDTSSSKEQSDSEAVGGSNNKNQDADTEDTTDDGNTDDSEQEAGESDEADTTTKNSDNDAAEDSEESAGSESETSGNGAEADTDADSDKATGSDQEGADEGASDDSAESEEEAAESEASEFDFDDDEEGAAEASEEEEEAELESESEESESEDEFDFDEDELLDDTIKNTYEDQELKAKHEARKIKRERTLQAAHNALADAKAKNKAPALIRELEKAIEALESLQEAVAKNLKDMSDEEFNLIVNRVFDAIDALGDSGLTYSSEEERQLKAKEIKADLEDRQTQAELSAEDVAQIRAETQAIKAREKENAKYKKRDRGSFKGFQDFLSSLYRAIALQVHVEETQDDTWSAINRRYSGTGVLQQGKRINELPNKKIPIIDFYFDQSGSWDEDDIKVGEKAVAALADMEEKGQIKINIYYFSNHVHTDAQSARNEGGTWAWNEIVKNVITTNATNVIIMTDSDMEDQWDLNSYWSGKQDKAAAYTVPGYVWYLWRGGSNAPRLPRDLKGRGGTQQFSFNSGDI
jgi:hypothetical protein